MKQINKFRILDLQGRTIWSGTNFDNAQLRRLTSSVSGVFIIEQFTNKNRTITRVINQ
ncbi:MAG: hypothetical protein GX640_08020 [Fibrobacter sp.]|nr:hypothetical protein [Fibrobacter sp.]